MKIGYLASGHQGTMIKLLEKNKHPRGQLLKALSSKHAQKIYIETKEGETKHVGYIVSGEWFDIFEVHSWESGKEKKHAGTE